METDTAPGVEPWAGKSRSHAELLEADQDIGPAGLDTATLRGAGVPTCAS